MRNPLSSRYHCSQSCSQRQAQALMTSTIFKNLVLLWLLRPPVTSLASTPTPPHMSLIDTTHLKSTYGMPLAVTTGTLRLAVDKHLGYCESALTVCICVTVLMVPYRLAHYWRHGRQGQIYLHMVSVFMRGTPFTWATSIVIWSL
jgi:hypothetical protein